MIETNTILVNPFFVDNTNLITLRFISEINGNKVNNSNIEILVTRRWIKIVESGTSDPKLEANLQNILRVVCSYFNLSIGSLVKKGRYDEGESARLIFCAAARRLTCHSLAEIGFIINRNYSTVINACKSVKSCQYKEKRINTWIDYNNVLEYFK